MMPELKIHSSRAAWLWEHVCHRTHGVDCEGGEVSELTCLAGAAIALGVPMSTSFNQNSKVHVANFLRQWADCIEGKFDV